LPAHERRRETPTNLLPGSAQTPHENRSGEFPLLEIRRWTARFTPQQVAKASAIKLSRQFDGVITRPYRPWTLFGKNRALFPKDRFEEQRTLGVGNIFYKVDEYPQLRDFFQRIGAQDKTQMVLIATPAPDRAASATSGTN
jgi:hypothetical protein